MSKLKIGVIGLGARGRSIVNATLVHMCESDIEIVSLCDIYEDRVNNAQDIVEKHCGYRPKGTLNYNDIINDKDISAVIIMAAWEVHIEIAIAAMKAGKYVGLEVGGAYSVDDCFRLVQTFEETGSHCMMLENCCYGDRELMLLDMTRNGVMGEVVYCTGGYVHDLRGEIYGGDKNRHYRLRNYLNRNCDNYPTHQLVPIGKILDINNGNRFVSLSSVSSCSKGMNAYAADRYGADDPLATAKFAQGDAVVTNIKCSGGQLITLTLDTTLPHSYSRCFSVRGTKASYFEDNDSFFFDHVHSKPEFEFNPKKLWNNASEYLDEYRHPIWKNYDPKGGHGGMDWLVYSAFVEAAKANVRPPIDTYDTATYMCITALSEQSIALNGAPLAVPDFTRGKWYYRDDIVDGYYNLDKIKK